MDIITSKKRIFSIIFLLSFAYFSAYMARKSFAVVIPEIVRITSLTKDKLGLPLTGLFICYGITQIFAGMIADRMNPKVMVFCALSISACINLFIPFFYSNIPLMVVLWSLNGITQAFIWPPMIRLSAVCFDKKTYEKSSTFVTLGGYCGQMFLYVLAWLIIKYSDFRNLFFIVCALNILVAVMFAFGTRKIHIRHEEPIKVECSSNEDKPKKNFFSFIFVIIIVSIIFTGSLRDSIESWAPTYFFETFNIESENAILGSIFLPLLSLVFLYLSLVLYQKVFKNPIIISIAFACLALVLMVLLMTLGKLSTVLTFALMSTIFGLACSINHCLISYIPIYFKSTGRVSSIASVLNASTYAGSALATYVIAYVSDENRLGWNGAIYIWFILIVLLLLLFVILIKPWAKKVKELALEN